VSPFSAEILPGTLCKKNGDRELWEYPFAVAGVNITFMLIQMLDLQAGLSVKLFSISYYVDPNCESSLAIFMNNCNLKLVLLQLSQSH